MLDAQFLLMVFLLVLSNGWRKIRNKIRCLGHSLVIEWELRDGERDIEARVTGQATFNSAYQMLNAARSGAGLAFIPRDMAEPYISDGRLCSVMEKWCGAFPGLHAYYSSRRHSSRAFTLVIDALRHQG